jgi:ABC-type branched-subunit amino acid transport system permease subunit
VRTLIGLVIGVALFLVGIPVLQSVVKKFGYYDNFTYEQAVLGMLLVLACIMAAQLTALRPPPPPKS